MKKFFVILVMVLGIVVNVFSQKTYKVKIVKIGNYDRGTEVVCEGGKSFYSSWDPQYRNFYNSLRSGDIIEVYEYEYHILGIKKVGHETPSYPNGGVIYEGRSGVYGSYYGGSYGYGYGDEGRVSVTIGGRHGGFSIDLPIRKKSKSSSTTTTTTTTPSTQSTTTTSTVPSTTTTRSTTTTTQTSDSSKEYRGEGYSFRFN
jgi:hypothetical protein